MDGKCLHPCSRLFEFFKAQRHFEPNAKSKLSCQERENIPVNPSIQIFPSGSKSWTDWVTLPSLLLTWIKMQNMVYRSCSLCFRNALHTFERGPNPESRCCVWPSRWHCFFLVHTTTTKILFVLRKEYPAANRCNTLYAYYLTPYEHTVILAQK